MDGFLLGIYHPRICANVNIRQQRIFVIHHYNDGAHIESAVSCGIRLDTAYETSHTCIEPYVVYRNNLIGNCYLQRCAGRPHHSRVRWIWVNWEMICMLFHANSFVSHKVRALQSHTSHHFFLNHIHSMFFVCV
jgi:hypothetical protein